MKHANAGPSDIYLSICIPTYNRGHTLGRLLDSICSEIQLLGDKDKNKIEVVISDNASDDNTEDVVLEYQKRGIPILYIKSDMNYGFGVNINKAVSYAHGEYCWLMGSDDILFHGCLSDIFSVQSLCKPDIIIGDVSTNGKVRSFLSLQRGVYPIEDCRAINKYIDSCSEISAFFAFISSIIVKNSYWKSVLLSDELISHPYTHQIRLLKSIGDTGANIYYLKSPVATTGIEINEWSSVIFNHFSLDCCTLRFITESFFPCDKSIKRSIARLILKQYSSTKIILSRSASSRSQWEDLCLTLRWFEMPETLLRKRFYDPLIYCAYRLAKMVKVKLNDFL